MKRSGYYLLILGIAIAIVSHFRWFTDFSILASGDWQVQLSESARQTKLLPLAWGQGGLGYFNIHAPFFLLHFLQGLLARIGLEFGATERLLYLWPITILTFVSSYLLIRRITKSAVAGFVGGCVYQFSVYFLLIQTQHIYIMLADALAPLAILACIELIEAPRVRSAIWAGLALFAVSAADFRIFYILSLVLIPYAFIDFLWRGRKPWREMSRHLALLAMPFFMVFALSAYWMIGFAATSTLATNELFQRPLFSSGRGSILGPLALFSSAWSDGAIEWFSSNPIKPRFWLYPLLAVAGFWLARRQRYARLFLIFALLGVFLTKQSAAPFGEVYGWLFHYLPGFNAFREASKFAVLQIIGYAALIGFFAAWVWEQYRGKWRQAVRILAISGTVGLCLLNARPLVDGSIGTLFAPITIDSDLARYNEWISAEPEYFRVLWTPRETTWALGGNLHPRVSNTGLNSEMVQQSLSLSGGPDYHPPMTAMLTAPSSDALLDRLAIKYVAVLPVGGKSETDPFAPYYLKRDAVVAELDAVPYLRRVNLGFDSLVLYENFDQRPRAYLTDAADQPPGAPTAWRPVAWEMINATEYRVTLTGITAPVYLNFVEQYHPDWWVYAGKFDWSRRFLTDRTSASGIAHERSWAGTNSYRIDLEPLCADNACRPNPNGGYDIELTLFFRSQQFFYVGLVISLMAFAAAIAGLVVTRRKKSPVKRRP